MEAVDNIIRAISSVSQALNEIGAAVSAQVQTTQQIASDVEETKTAVNDVSNRIIAIDTEVNGTCSMVRDVYDAASTVAANVNNQQKSLVQIVRTCSAEVDRRTNVRVDVNVPGIVDACGQNVLVHLFDLSQCVARLMGSVPSAASSFYLHIRRLSLPLRARRGERRGGSACHLRNR